ncbi:hypothetical protein [Paenibacillus donghaensis]|uniref:hypothetical protein n=1 Tax=Paenibacillus donghaensis TaxID=414771 RepID=UPI0012FD9016|nr:hypothetical protein [Paenibacillus donghaensis]
MYKQFVHLLNFVSNLDIDPKEKKEIYFDTSEEVIVKEVIIELEGPFLKRLEKETISDTFNEKDTDAVAFRDRMLKLAEAIGDPELSGIWTEIIETLSRLESRKYLFEIMGELSNQLFLSKDTLYDRFMDLMRFGDMNMKNLKENGRQYCFFVEEERFIKDLVTEMVQGNYLSKFTKGKPAGKSIEEDDKIALEFRERMLEKCKNIENEDLYKSWHGIIELLSQHELRLQRRKTMEILKEGMEGLVTVTSDKNKTYEERIDTLYRLNGVLNAIFKQYTTPKDK